MGFRYYAPSLGRFVSRDPMGLSAGSNVYEYCFSDPVNLADPAGLDSLWRYFCDVGCVFKGYGQFAWGTLRSPYDMYCYFSANGVSGRSVWKMAKGGAVAWWDGISGTNPEKFGNSFAAVLAVGASAAAPFAGAAGEAGGGLGVLAGKSALVSERGLSLVERHVASFGADVPNAAMIGRLQSALTYGDRISGADLSFYVHELHEATLVGRGMAQDVAHQAAFTKYRVSPYSVYHPDVIAAYPGNFNTNWIDFWR